MTRTLKSWYSFEISLLRVPRVLTYTEGNTEAPELARVRRSAGVLRPWHAGRDTSENSGSLHRPLVPGGVGPGQHEPTFLRAMADKAKSHKQHRFRDLYRCLDADLLQCCRRELNKAAASGVDGVTASEYAEDLDTRIEALAERLKAKRYRARLVRRVYIPKENGKERLLGIPALEDKLIQSAVSKPKCVNENETPGCRN